MSDDKLVERLHGRAAFCRDRGEIKTPELLEAAVTALQSERASMEGEIEALRGLLRQARMTLAEHCSAEFEVGLMQRIDAALTTGKAE
jgi:hypothetical protein